MEPTNREIRKAFRMRYKGNRNFLTQQVHSFGYSLLNPDLVFEISFDRGIFSDWMVGITVLELSTNEPRHDLSKCISGNNKWNLFSKAREYGESLE